MGTLPMEKQKIELEDGRIGRVEMFTTTDDLMRKETDGVYFCMIEIGEKTYTRHFLIKEYSDIHYSNFLKKFARNPEYREKWIKEEYEN